MFNLNKGIKNKIELKDYLRLANISSMKVYIGIRSEGQTYFPLLIGYTNDGGFWLSDLYLKQATAYITKMTIPISSPSDKVTMAPVNKKAEWQTYLNPKLTHHSDGTAHISGSGIISGFYKTKRRAKGVYVESMNLFRNDNDGGPIFTFSFWGLNDFGSSSANANQNVVFAEDDIGSYRLNLEGQSDFCIEGFYISKALEKMIDPISRIFIKQHPVFGELPLKILPTPDNCPGYIGLACFRGITGSKEKSGFSLTGGPGKINKDGYFENIAVMKPSIGELLNRGSVKSLDLDLLKIRLIIFKIDRYLASMLEVLKIKFKKTIESVRDDILKISPTKIIKFRLSLLMNTGLMYKRKFIKISRLINTLVGLEYIERYRSLYFYTGTVGNFLNKDGVARLFRELSHNVTTPIFAHPRHQVEEATYSICSIDRFRSELLEFLSDQNLPTPNADKLKAIENILRKIIRENALIVSNVPEALPGTNIRWFMIAPYAQIMTSFPSALYSSIGLFSSHVPLSLVVDGSIIDRPEDVPEYRHLVR